MLKRKIWICTFLLAAISMGCQMNHEKRLQQLKVNFQEGDLPSIHPHLLIVYLRGLSISKCLYEGLTRIDGEGRVKLAGAESYKISQNQLQYTFVLRKNKWSDGTSVTAFQYENAWKEALSPTSNCSRADLLYMIKNAEEAKKGNLPLQAVGIKALDEKTLIIDLEYPSPYFLELLAQPICAPLVNVEKKEPLQFNGPFVVDEWKKGEFIKLKPNSYFWDHRNIFLKEIDIFMIEDQSTVFSSFERGEVDWIGIPLCPLTKDQIIHLKEKQVLKSHPLARAFWIFLNNQNSALSNPSIRQALSLTIDRAAITKYIFIDATPLYKPIPINLLPVTTSEPLKENIEKAQSLLDQGLKQLGYTRKNFPPLTITYSQQANRKQLAEYLQETWEKTLKIDIEVKSEDWTTLRSNLEKGAFEISGAFEAPYYRDPIELLKRLTTINPGNFSRWVDPDFKEKISLALHESNLEHRSHLLSQAEKILIEEVPFIPIFSDTILYSHSLELKGFMFDSLGAIDFSYASFE